MEGISKDTVDRLRRAFNQGFTRPYAGPRDAPTELLVVRAGDHRLALRSSDVRSVLKSPPVTPIPSAAAGLAGIAAVRGTIIGMYCLSALVGGGPVTSNSDWAVLCGDGTIGLLFDALERYVLVDGKSIGRPDRERNHSAGELVQLGAATIALVAVPSLIDRIMRGSAHPAEPREHTP